MANNEISMKKSNTTYAVIIYIILSAFILIAIGPILIMWLTAFRPSTEIVLNPLTLPESVTFQNIIDAWNMGKMDVYMFNSIKVIIPRVFGVLFLACLAGYAFGKLKFPGRDPLFYFILLGMMIPFQAIMIPLYYNLQKLGMINRFSAIIIPVFGLSMPFTIFFMRAFFKDLPDELIESAKLDGAGEFRTFLSIMLPLTVPALTSLLIFEFMWGWNDFMLPLIMIYDDKLRTLPLGLMYFKGRYQTNYSLIAAGVTISSVPIVIIYIIFQKSFIQGMTAGAVKG